MANANAPFGFSPARHVSALGHTLGKYKIASGLAENIVIGDLVKLHTDGTIKKAAAGDAFLGVFMGYHIDVQGMASANYAGDISGAIPSSKVWKSGQAIPAGSSVYALVHDDPGETLKVQTSDTVDEDDIGKLVNLVDGTADLFMGASRQTTGAPGGAASQFRIERILQEPQRSVDGFNNTTGFGLSGPGQYAIIEVKPAKHQRGGSAMAVVPA
jgi:hypothetical protein